MQEKRLAPNERSKKSTSGLFGYGTSVDAYHLTAGPEDGSEATSAMYAALYQAGIAPEAVGHIDASW
ncbi:hypothetical protein APA386B_1P216 (plasmid) [Acetobacter pasteurianus 386B]|nr:hypothetical protein APA386B_1P216 [Acetobacter pasteurianus 386B]